MGKLADRHLVLDKELWEEELKQEENKVFLEKR